MRNHQWLAALILIESAMVGGSLSAKEGVSLHDHGDDHPAGGGSYFFEPFEHIHSSDLGTPYVHSFNIEPAFTGRDLFLDYRYRDGDLGVGHEIELELEWAFTRRLGIIVELPYLSEGGADGFGDLAVVPRAMLLESERFLLTSQIEVVAPTGTEGIGGETAIAPGLVGWMDLGDWWTLNSQLSVEHSFDEDETELLFGFGLIKSFGRPGSGSQSGHGDHQHHSGLGLFSLHLEVTGSVGLGGEDEGAVGAQGLVGLSYGLSDHVDVRLGYEFPLTSPRDFDSGLVTGLIWHF